MLCLLCLSCLIVLFDCHVERVCWGRQWPALPALRARFQGVGLPIYQAQDPSPPHRAHTSMSCRFCCPLAGERSGESAKQHPSCRQRSLLTRLANLHCAEITRSPVEEDSDLEWFDADGPLAVPAADAAAASDDKPPASQPAAAGPSAAAAEPAGAPQAPEQPAAAPAAVKRGAPLRKRRRQRQLSDSGDEEGFEFAAAPARQPAPTAATAADAAAPPQQPSATASLAATRQSDVAGAAETADATAPLAGEGDGMEWEDAGLAPAPAPEAGPSAAPAAATASGGAPQAAPEPQRRQQHQQQKAAQPASHCSPGASPAEVRDTDDWGVEIVDLEAGSSGTAMEAAGPDHGGRAAAIAEAANNARGAGDAAGAAAGLLLAEACRTLTFFTRCDGEISMAIEIGISVDSSDPFIENSTKMFSRLTAET